MRNVGVPLSAESQAPTRVLCRCAVSVVATIAAARQHFVLSCPASAVLKLIVFFEDKGYVVLCGDSKVATNARIVPRRLAVYTACTLQSDHIRSGHSCHSPTDFRGLLKFGYDIVESLSTHHRVKSMCHTAARGILHPHDHAR